MKKWAKNPAGLPIKEGKGRIQGEREGESAVLVRDKVIDQD